MPFIHFFFDVKSYKISISEGIGSQIINSHPNTYMNHPNKRGINPKSHCQQSLQETNMPKLPQLSPNYPYKDKMMLHRLDLRIQICD